MRILMISGSARKDSSNIKLLNHIPALRPEHQFDLFLGLKDLPLFHADLQDQPDPSAVIEWKQALREADRLIICTPEYLHNLPALLKNAFEWVTTSGELHQKKVLPITFTPNAPRGEKAMQSLIWTLQALNAQVVGQIALHQTALRVGDPMGFSRSQDFDLLKDVIEYFIQY